MNRSFLLMLLLVLPLATSAAEPSGKKGTNPEYLAWSQFPVGSSVTTKIEGTGTGRAMGTFKKCSYTEIYTLVKVTEDNVEITYEKTGTADGKEVKVGPVIRTHQKLIPVEMIPKPKITETKESEVKIDGVTYKATYTRIDGSNFDAEGSTSKNETWRSPKVPGGLLKCQEEMDGTYGYTLKIEVTKIVISKK